MARVKGAMMARKRRNKTLKLAKGYWGAKSKHFKMANEQVMKSLTYAYVGRRLKKRDFRQLWITRISAACKINGMNYSTFMHGLKVAGICPGVRRPVRHRQEGVTVLKSTSHMRRAFSCGKGRKYLVYYQGNTSSMVPREMRRCAAPSGKISSMRWRGGRWTAWWYTTWSRITRRSWRSWCCASRRCRYCSAMAKTNIVGKYGSQVQAVLKKAAELDIAMLLPLHGFVWRKELGYLLHKYDLWSRYEPEERGVLIAYASVYGNTENAANILACRLSERGVKVQMFDTSVTPTSYILSAAFRYSHLVFAATTYNAGVFITMEELLHDIAAHDLQNRRVVLLENGSWAPAGGKEMQKILQPLKGWQQMEDTFTIRSALREDQTMQLERLAATLAADVQAAAPAEEKPEGQHRYVCKVCGYVYEGDSLPEDYKCPLCGAGAEYFKQES